MDLLSSSYSPLTNNTTNKQGHSAASSTSKAQFKGADIETTAGKHMVSGHSHSEESSPKRAQIQERDTQICKTPENSTTRAEYKGKPPEEASSGRFEKATDKKVQPDHQPLQTYKALISQANDQVKKVRMQLKTITLPPNAILLLDVISTVSQQTKETPAGEETPSAPKQITHSLTSTDSSPHDIRGHREQADQHEKDGHDQPEPSNKALQLIEEESDTEKLRADFLESSKKNTEQQYGNQADRSASTSQTSSFAYGASEPEPFTAHQEPQSEDHRTTEKDLKAQPEQDVGDGHPTSREPTTAESSESNRTAFPTDPEGKSGEPEEAAVESNKGSTTNSGMAASEDQDPSLPTSQSTGAEEHASNYPPLNGVSTALGDSSLNDTIVPDDDGQTRKMSTKDRTEPETGDSQLPVEDDPARNMANEDRTETQAGYSSRSSSPKPSQHPTDDKQVSEDDVAAVTDETLQQPEILTQTLVGEPHNRTTSPTDSEGKNGVSDNAEDVVDSNTGSRQPPSPKSSQPAIDESEPTDEFYQALETTSDDHEQPLEQKTGDSDNPSQTSSDTKSQTSSRPTPHSDFDGQTEDQRLSTEDGHTRETTTKDRTGPEAEGSHHTSPPSSITDNSGPHQSASPANSVRSYLEDQEKQQIKSTEGQGVVSDEDDGLTPIRQKLLPAEKTTIVETSTDKQSPEGTRPEADQVTTHGTKAKGDTETKTSETERNSGKSELTSTLMDGAEMESAPTNNEEFTSEYRERLRKPASEAAEVNEPLVSEANSSETDEDTEGKMGVSKRIDSSGSTTSETKTDEEKEALKSINFPEGTTSKDIEKKPTAKIESVSSESLEGQQNMGSTINSRPEGAAEGDPAATGTVSFEKASTNDRSDKTTSSPKEGAAKGATGISPPDEKSPAPTISLVRTIVIEDEQGSQKQELQVKNQISPEKLKQKLIGEVNKLRTDAMKDQNGVINVQLKSFNKGAKGAEPDQTAVTIKGEIKPNDELENVAHSLIESLLKEESQISEQKPSEEGVQ